MSGVCEKDEDKDDDWRYKVCWYKCVYISDTVFTATSASIPISAQVLDGWSVDVNGWLI